AAGGDGSEVERRRHGARVCERRAGRAPKDAAAGALEMGLLFRAAGLETRQPHHHQRRYRGTLGVNSNSRRKPITNPAPCSIGCRRAPNASSAAPTNAPAATAPATILAPHDGSIAQRGEPVGGGP